MGVCVVSFSSRANGNCAQIGRLICSLLKDAEWFDFSSFTIHPCGECGYECFSKIGKCPWAADAEYRLLDRIMHSDMTYFILPNYCDYPCANFFIFNERSQCCFQGRPELLDTYEKVPKRVVVISNTNEENFRQAMAYQAYDAPDILFMSAKKYGKSSISGDLLTSGKAVADIADFVRRQ
ncbi:MAG: hypothetical protein J5564_06105 [Clostridia bacterium]|nr:hypothetical protein [Clostridia bacterium]